MRPLLSGVTISTSLTNCLKMSWCLLFHLFSLLRSSFNSSFHTLGVQCQAVLKYVFTHNESLFGGSLQLLPEGGWDEHSSFCVRPDFNIA